MYLYPHCLLEIFGSCLNPFVSIQSSNSIERKGKVGMSFVFAPMTCLWDNDNAPSTSISTATKMIMALKIGLLELQQHPIT